MIIKNFIDNDLYKFTTMNAIQKKFPKAEVVYSFINRGKTVFPDGFAKELRKEVDAMSSLSLTSEAEKFLKKRCYYFDPVFFDLLKGYKYNPDEVVIKQQGGELQIDIIGLWYRTVLWEVPLMALISELYFKMTNQLADEYTERAKNKAKEFVKLKANISEFGTRRRYSFDVQDKVCEILKDEMGNYLKGSSNMYMAMKYDITPIGTHPHEWFMYHGAHYGYRMANQIGMKHWVDVYEGDLGIALTDTYTSDNFFANFSTKYAKLFDGVRWDSGCPIEFTKKTLAHYQQLRINPLSKTIVYSDALDLKKVQEIKKFVDGKIQNVYGIGTYLTNDVGVKPLNMVIKLTKVKPSCKNNYFPTIKLSDVDGKHTGSETEIQNCLNTIKN